MRALSLASLPDWPRAMAEDAAAAYVGLSGATIRRLMTDGAAPFPRPITLSPGRVAWLREDLDRWLDAKAGRGAPSGKSIFANG